MASQVKPNEKVKSRKRKRDTENTVAKAGKTNANANAGQIKVLKKQKLNNGGKQVTQIESNESPTKIIITMSPEKIRFRIQTAENAFHSWLITVNAKKCRLLREILRILYEMHITDEPKIAVPSDEKNQLISVQTTDKTSSFLMDACDFLGTKYRQILYNTSIKNNNVYHNTFLVEILFDSWSLSVGFLENVPLLTQNEQILFYDPIKPSKGIKIWKESADQLCQIKCDTKQSSFRMTNNKCFTLGIAFNYGTLTVFCGKKHFSNSIKFNCHSAVWCPIIVINNLKIEQL